MLLAVALAACKEVVIPGVYRIDVQQGNVINQEQLAALEPGMEKRKVRFILGTPLVADAFNQDRWDYYYSLEKRGDERVQRVISVFFADERLVRVGGDVRAAKGPILVENRGDELVTVPDGYRDEGILAALTPDLFSGSKKFVPPEGTTATDDPASPAGDGSETPPPPDIQVTDEDERYLRELLEGFGEAPVTAPSLDVAADAAVEPEAQEKEGLLSRWARQLGLKDDVPDDDTPATE